MQQLGRYRIEGELGRGAMGIVYRALDTAIGRTVAIKTIRLSELVDESERARLHDRLFREAQSAGILSHPNIVTIYDISEEDAVAYVAMECVNGQTLDRIMDADAPDGTFVLTILSQTAAALDYAHRRGIVHRDIKPANIIVDEGPVAKITDFGVARILSHEMTHSGSMVGTPNYMSPEQIQGRTVDGRSDQFSLAVIAYELLTGEKPFTAESIGALAYRIVNEDPPAVHQLNPTLDWPVDTVLRRALSKQPQERYPSCSDFIVALENSLRACRDWKPLPPGSSQNLATMTGLAAAAPVVSEAPWRRETPVDAETEPEAESDEVPTPLRWTRLAAMILLAIAAAAALIVGAMHYFDDQGTETAETPPAVTTPEPPPPKRPSAMPALPGESDADTTEDPAEEEAPSPSSQATKPPASRPTRPAQIQLVSNPPGALIVVDGSNDTSCTTPCSVELPPGRHTLSATLDGYRRALRIFETPNDTEMFVNMDKAAGTVMLRSEPKGATILVDGETRTEKTPAVLTLPAGAHTIELVYEDARESHNVVVKESGITNIQVTFQ